MEEFDDPRCDACVHSVMLYDPTLSEHQLYCERMQCYVDLSDNCAQWEPEPEDVEDDEFF